METVGALRCFVCGGHSGTPCRGGVGWAGENGQLQETDMMAQDPVQECTDLINNRGCVKQFVNGGNILLLMSYINTQKLTGTVGVSLVIIGMDIKFNNSD